MLVLEWNDEYDNSFMIIYTNNVTYMYMHKATVLYSIRHPYLPLLEDKISIKLQCHFIHVNI